MSIRENFKKTEKLYHYTTFENAKLIIESNCLRLGMLNNMNDIHENDKLVFHDSEGSPIEDISYDVLDALYAEMYKYRQISLTDDGDKDDNAGFDLHQMWGLYANKGDGVCLVFDKKEMEKNPDWENVNPARVNYANTRQTEPFVITNSSSSEEVKDEVRRNISKIFFHKRKEWEHEQEYRLLKRCPNPNKVEYFRLGHALKFIILSSKLRNTDEVLYFKNLNDIKELAEKIKTERNTGDNERIPILVYGNGLLDYCLCTDDGEEEIWNSNEGYDVLIPGINCEISV